MNDDASFLLAAGNTNPQDIADPPAAGLAIVPTPFHETSTASQVQPVVAENNAVSWGWFLNPTLWDDTRFATPDDQGEQDRTDLLTVLTQERGHGLGSNDADDGGMEAALLAGTRRTPATSWGFDLVVLDQLFAAEPTLAERD
jgi:hypothetical protein